MESTIKKWVVRHWNMLPGKVVGVLSLEVLKAGLETGLVQVVSGHGRARTR